MLLGHATDHVAEARINIRDFRRHAVGEVTHQEGRDVTDVIDRYIAAQGRSLSDLTQNFAKALDTTCGQGFDGACADTVDANPLGALALGGVAYRGLK